MNVKIYKSKSILNTNKSSIQSNFPRTNKNLTRNKSAFLLKFASKTKNEFQKMKPNWRSRNKSSTKSSNDYASKSPNAKPRDSQNSGLSKSQVFKPTSRTNFLKNMIVNDKYKIVRKLGEGCYSKVYLVKHVRTGSFYALKSIKLESLSAKNKFMNLEVGDWETRVEGDLN